MAYITKKGKKPNMRDVAGEDHKPEPRGNPGVVGEDTGNRAKMTPVSDKDIDVIKGDKSESGSNSYNAATAKAIKMLKNAYNKAKD
jgi:hypothetical protein